MWLLEPNVALFLCTKTDKQILNQSIGGGSVGKVVASNARSLQFESSHRQNFTINEFTVEKKKIYNEKKKETGSAHLKNIKRSMPSCGQS